MPAVSTNETSARSRVSRIPSPNACTSHDFRSSSTQPAATRPSTRSLTVSLDDSTTVTLSIPLPPYWLPSHIKQAACQLQADCDLKGEEKARPLRGNSFGVSPLCGIKL